MAVKSTWYEDALALKHERTHALRAKFRHLNPKLASIHPDQADEHVIRYSYVVRDVRHFFKH